MTGCEATSWNSMSEKGGGDRPLYSPQVFLFFFLISRRQLFPVQKKIDGEMGWWKESGDLMACFISPMLSSFLQLQYDPNLLPLPLSFFSGYNGAMQNDERTQPPTVVCKMEA